MDFTTLGGKAVPLRLRTQIDPLGSTASHGLAMLATLLVERVGTLELLGKLYFEGMSM
jgi:hypothetical protein